jgi:hypothetical protein
MYKISSYISILILLIGCILYPLWLTSGVLENWYLKISVAVACYGGLIANIIFLIKHKKS